MKTVIFSSINSIESTTLANKVPVMIFVFIFTFLSIFLTVIICCQKKLKRRDLQFKDDNPEGASSSEPKTQPSPSSAMENQSVKALATLRGVKNLKISESTTSNSRVKQKRNAEESNDDLGTLRNINTKPESKHQRPVDQGKGEPADETKVKKILKLKFQVKEQSKVKQQSEQKVAEHPVANEMQDDRDKKVPQQAYATMIGVENRMLPSVRKDKASIEPAKRVDTEIEPIKKVEAAAYGTMGFCTTAFGVIEKTRKK